MANFSISGNKILGKLHDSAVEQIKKDANKFVKQESATAETLIINTAVNPGEEFVLGKPGTFQLRVQAAMFESEDKAKALITEYLQYFCVDSKITEQQVAVKKVSGEKSGEMFVCDVDFDFSQGNWKTQSFQQAKTANGEEKVKESRNFTSQELVKEILVGDKDKAKTALEKILSNKIKTKIRTTLKNFESDGSK